MTTVAAPATVSFRLGQMVRWPAAPGAIAQVVELRRTHVRIFYLCKSGRERAPIVDAWTLDLLQDPTDPLLPIDNPFGRAIVRAASKSFSV